MPEMRFIVRWPDGRRTACYSPSLVVEEHLAVGARYPLDEFVRTSAAALAVASDRVAARYGFACSRALAQIEDIRREAARQVPPDAPTEPPMVTVVGFERL